MTPGVMRRNRLKSEGAFIGGCPCGWWAVANCRYIRERARMCRTQPANRPELPTLDAAR